MKLHISLKLIPTLILILILGGCSEREILETYLPQPVWLASTPVVTINTLSEISELWRSRKRCCVSKKKLTKNNRELYASCYDMIARGAGTDETFQCVYLMSTGMSGDIRYQLYNRILDEHYDYKSPTNNCSNCAPADKVARTVSGLANLEYRDGKPQVAIDLIEKIVADRGSEISAFIQIETLVNLAWYYREQQSISTEKYNWLKTTYETNKKILMQRSGSKSDLHRLGDYLTELSKMTVL